jgi:hypothetical protein
MKKIFLISIIIILLISSCKKDENKDTTPTTVTEDKSNFKAMFDKNIGCVTEVKNGEFFQFITSFLRLQNGKVLNETWVSDMGTKFDRSANLEQIDQNNRFSLSNFGSIYNWNNSDKSWAKSSNGQVVVNFPSDITQSNNNCTFKISDYSDAAYTVNNETIYLPKTVKANMTKNSVELFNLDFSGSYNNGGFPAPVDVSMTLKLKPHTYSVKINQITSTQFGLNIEMFSGTTCSETCSLTISLASNDYENLNLERDFNNIKLEFKKDDILVKGTWDAKTFYSLNNPNTDQINSTINFTVEYKSFKIGDLIFKDVGDNRELFIFYKDGTSENSSIYYETFYSDFKAIYEPFFGK